MAIGNDRPSGTTQERRFEENAAKTGSALKNMGDLGSNLQQAQRQLEFENSMISFIKVYGMSKQLEELKKQLDRVQEVHDEDTAKAKVMLEKLKKDKEEIRSKIFQAEVEGNEQLKAQLQEEEKDINDQIRKVNEHLTEVHNHLSKMADKYNTMAESHDTMSEILEDFTHVQTDAFDNIRQTVENVTEFLNYTREAKQVVQAEINNSLQEIEKIRVAMDLAAENGDEDKVAELQEAHNKAVDELNTQIEARRHLLAEERAGQRTLRNAGLDESGKPSDERGFNEFFTAAGGRLGAMVGSAFGPIGTKAGTVIGSMVGGGLAGGGEQAGLAFGDAADAELIPDTLLDITEKLGGPGELISTVQNILKICGILRAQASKFVDQAAESLKSYYGVIVANTIETERGWKQISEKADNLLTTSRWVQQTDYLSKIAELSNQGLMRDIETAAILETIKNKSLPTFNSMSDSMKRLIRLNETDYIRQYGIEMQLKRVLNSVFQDSGYLSSLFDSVRDAIIDASAAYNGDTTAFNSAVQTWMGYMYSTGVSSNVINNIAKGINALGSGNLQSLAGDESTQRLFLLAMDRVGLDYADILQQGLSLDDTNKLLASVVGYLAEIANTTNDNLVLQSSYSNLFNMTIADMQAMTNLSGYASSVTSNIANTGTAVANTVYGLNLLQDTTSYSEQFDNVIKNLQYTYGESIAQGARYIPYRIAEETINALQPFADLGGAMGKVAQITQRVAAVTEYPILATGLINLFADASQSIFNSVGASNSLVGFLNTSSNSTLQTATSAVNTLLASYNAGGSSSSSVNNNFKRAGMTTFTDNTVNSFQAEESWKNGEDEESADSVILKEMAKTLMKTQEENHYAFAVSLEGMNDNVLRSFASIFADEDAMENTFTGENEVLKKSLFNYLEDGTSNSDGTTTGGSSGGGTANGTPTQSQIDAATKDAKDKSDKNKNSKDKKDKKKKKKLKTVKYSYTSKPL